MTAQRILIIFILCLSISIAKSQVKLVFQDSITAGPIDAIVVQQFQSQAFDNTIDVQVSNNDGAVSLTKEIDKDSIFFTTTHLQYNVVQWKVATADCNPCILKLIPEEFKLPEIKVTDKDQGIRVINDTIRFDLNVFKNKSQKDLEDLLKDLPGLEIRESGEILYNNKKIDKVLLSGKDVINSQFDLANRLVRKDIVETVQIVPGEKNLEDDTTPQYLDIVLAKDNQVLADIGVGISHEARTQQKASALFTGDRPLSSFFNLVRKSLDQPALSGGDAIRKKDFDILDARSKLLGGSPDLSSGNIVQDGIDYNDLLFQFNAKLDKNKYLSSNYFDLQKRTYSNLNTEQTTDPITDLNLEFRQSEQRNDYKALSAYTKHDFALNSNSNFQTYLSFDINSDDIDEMGSSQFLQDTSTFSSAFDVDKQCYVWYNSYSFEPESKFKLKLESDLSFDKEERSTSFLSSDSLFQFGVTEQSNFVVDQERDRSTLSALISPTLELTLNEWHSIGLSGKYIYTRQRDESTLLQDPTVDIFNTNTTRNIQSYDSGLHYDYKKDKTKIRVEAGYAAQKFRGIVDERQDAFVFMVRYNYKFNPKFLWFNSLSRSLTRFSNQELFTSVNFQDNRSYSIYTPVSMPGFTQWNATTGLRYLNTANAKIAIGSVNYSRSGRSLAPLNTISNNAQIVQYIEAEASNQYRANGFFTWPIGSNKLSGNVNLSYTNAFVVNDADFEDINSLFLTSSLKYNMKLNERADLRLGFGYSERKQFFESFRSSFTTFTPSLQFEQFLEPKIWLNIHYQPILRVGLDNQQVIDIAISTKFLKDKLTIELKVVDLLNFDNPEFIQRSIDPFLIREAISARVGGYALLSAAYQFQ